MLLVQRNDGNNYQSFRRIGDKIANEILGVSGGSGCLSGEVILFGQTKTLDKLYKSGNKFIETVSLKTQYPNSKPASQPIKTKSEIIPTGRKEVYEIEFEDGRKVIATEEHRFFTRQKRYIETEVRNLKIGDRLRAQNPTFLSSYWEKAKNYEAEKRKKQFNSEQVCRNCSKKFIIKFRVGSYPKLCSDCKAKTDRIPIKTKENVWDKEEIELLKKYYPTTSKDEILKLLPKRSWSAITHKVLKFKIRKIPAWTETEETILKENYSTKTRKELSLSLPQRNWSAIMHRAFRLKLKRIYFKGEPARLRNKTDNPSKRPEVRQKNSIRMKNLIRMYPKKSINARLRRNFMTRPEREFKKILVEEFKFKEDNDFFFNQYFKTKVGYKFPDFILPRYKLIIECDGEYWHKRNEQERDNLFKEKGYSIIHFSDKKILKNRKEVVQCLRQSLKV